MNAAEVAAVKLQDILRKKVWKESLRTQNTPYHKSWTPSAHLYMMIPNIGGVNVSHSDHKSATELDSHTNMPVAGAHSTIISRTGLYAEVAAYSPNFPHWKIDTVDMALAYDDPYSLVTCLLAMKNTLHIPQIYHNLITPFILWEADLKVSGEANIHADNPTIDHHAIYDYETKLRIDLQLKGIFSHFPTRELSSQECENWEDCEVIFLTPDSATWNPNWEHFAQEKDGMLDADGDITMHNEKEPTQLITEADLIGLYSEPLQWGKYVEIVDEQFQISCINSGMPLTDEEACKLNEG